MKFLYWLEKLRVGGLNEFMLLITQLGEETAFLVVALIMFWCVSKYKGYYILSVGFLGTLANQFMKLWFRVPRPWVLDENFTILEQAREAASGYSFPSGHTQNAVGTFGGIAYTVKNRWVRIGCLLVVLLVPFSRMYIGVHTPPDVLVSFILAVALILLLKPVVLGKNGRAMPYLLGFMTLCAIGFMLFVLYYPFPENIDQHNLDSGIKNAFTLTGCLAGLLIVYFVDEKWLRFKTKAAWWAQLIKVGLGLIFVLAIKSGLKAPLNALIGENFGRFARYCLIVIFAGIVWPLSFKLFSKTAKDN